MWQQIIIYLGLFALKGAVQEIDNNTDVLSLSYDNLTTTESFTETTLDLTTIKEETTTKLLTTTTVKPTTRPAPTLPPKITTKNPTNICWCDRTSSECDMNCCCDQDCSITQKQVFSQCSDMPVITDPKSCYSSNIFFRKPSTIKGVKDEGLFCIVKDNLLTKKDFKLRAPIMNLEEFNRVVRKWRRLGYTRHFTKEEEFKAEADRGGSTIWSVEGDKLQPFHILSSVFGDLCLTTIPVRYLNDVSSSCNLILPRPQADCTQALQDFWQTFVDLKILTSPLAVNVSDLKQSLEDCTVNDTCISTTIYDCKTPKCIKIEKIPNSWKTCKQIGFNVHFEIKHNGTQGIQDVNIYISQQNVERLNMNVKFLWSDSEKPGFVRSGNPGYINGKPVLAGTKIIKTSNDTLIPNKEAIKMTTDPRGWLTIIDSDRGDCSRARQSVLFNVNVKASCFFKAEKKYFTKNGCLEMQKSILGILLGEKELNLTSNLSKFLGVFGNSRVQTMTDWLEILIDSFPLISEQPTFENSSDSISCRNMFTNLYVDIAIAKFGPFINPQNKIVGALMRFGTPKVLTVRCTGSKCDQMLQTENFKLGTEVNFLEISRPAVREFAQPPGLEAKLPHDFFYPFLSSNTIRLRFNFWTGFAVVFHLYFLYV